MNSNKNQTKLSNKEAFLSYKKHRANYAHSKYAELWGWHRSDVTKAINNWQVALDVEHVEPVKSVATPSTNNNSNINVEHAILNLMEQMQNLYKMNAELLEEIKNIKQNVEHVEQNVLPVVSIDNPSKVAGSTYVAQCSTITTANVEQLSKAPLSAYFLLRPNRKTIFFKGYYHVYPSVSQDFYISLEISSLSLTYWNSTLKEKEKLKQKEKERIGRNPSVAKLSTSVKDSLTVLESVVEPSLPAIQQSLQAQEVAENKDFNDFGAINKIVKTVENLTPKQQKEVARLEKEREKALLLEKREVLLDEALLMWNELVSTPLGRAKVFNVNSSITRGMLFHTLEKASVELELKGERRIFQGLDLWQLICWTLGKSEFYKGKPNAYTLSSVANFDLVGEKIAQSSVDVAMNIANPIKEKGKINLDEIADRAIKEANIT